MKDKILNNLDNIVNFNKQMIYLIKMINMNLIK